MKSQLLDRILLDNGGPMTSITSLVDSYMLDILGHYYITRSCGGKKLGHDWVVLSLDYK